MALSGGIKEDGWVGPVATGPWVSHDSVTLFRAAVTTRKVLFI